MNSVSNTTNIFFINDFKKVFLVIFTFKLDIVSIDYQLPFSSIKQTANDSEIFHNNDLFNSKFPAIYSDKFFVKISIIAECKCEKNFKSNFFLPRRSRIKKLQSITKLKFILKRNEGFNNHVNQYLQFFVKLLSFPSSSESL